jgi:peptide/nickel transport system permease protein
MSTPEIYIEADDLTEELRPWWVKLWSLCKRQPLGAAGAMVVIAMILMAVFAEFISPYDPEANAFEHMLEAPNANFWFGTDQFGRDILTRLIYGARTALFVGFTCAFVGAFGGLVLGVASAYYGGKFDLIVQRIMDVFMAFPLIILALAVVAPSPFRLSRKARAWCDRAPCRYARDRTWTRPAPAGSRTRESSCGT